LISYLIISSVKADKELGKWMLAVTAGVFFYLALGVMVNIFLTKI
jgi:zinc transporter ZupT